MPTKTAPKIAVIGAGSHFFGRAAILGVARHPLLRASTLALVDTDEPTLATMLSMAERVVAATGAPMQVMGATDRRQVLADADFVILTFSRQNALLRGLDCEVSAQYGLTMCSGDTIGPGGVFRALREIPLVLDIARDVAELAPRAWMINLVNPTATVGLALTRYAQEVHSFALCDSLHGIRLALLKEVGVLPPEATAIPPEVAPRLDLAIGGVNHFTWLVRFRYDGEDLLPKWLALRAEAAANEGAGGDSKHSWNESYASELAEVFGVYPMCIHHTKEYVPFYQGYGVTPVRPAPLSRFDAVARQQAMEARRAENAAYAQSGDASSPVLTEPTDDVALDVISAMWEQTGEPHYLNTTNHGAISNLPDDAFVEVECDLDRQGPRPRPFGELPRGVLGRTQQVLDTHELTAAAAVSYDRRLVLRALATDPLVVNLGDARAIMDELFTRERAFLDPRWYR